MDQATKMKQLEEMGRQLSTRKFNRGNCSKVGAGVVPINRRAQQHRNMTPLDDPELDSEGEVEAHEPRVVQLNLKASLMGVHILDDDEELFFSRQSSMSSMMSDKFRSRPSTRHGMSITATSGMSHATGRAQSGSSDVGPSVDDGSCLEKTETIASHQFVKSKAPSGLLYPSPQIGSGANSSILNTAHFTFSDATTTGSSDVTHKIYKQLLGQSRLQECIDDDVGVEMIPKSSRSDQQTQSSSGVAVLDKHSPVSTLDHLVSCPASPTFSERLFGYEFTRDPPPKPRQSSQRPDARSAPAAQIVVPNARQLNSQLGQYSISIPAMSDYDDIDDDDIIIEDDIIFEIPNEISLRYPCEQHHDAELAMVGVKSKPTQERWSSNRKSFNLDLEQIIPVKALSTRPSDLGRSVKTNTPRYIPTSSLNSSFDGGSRRLKRGTLSSSCTSEHSRWLEFESEMNDFVISSARLQMDMSHEPHLDEPDLEQVDNDNRFQNDGGAKMDEEDFPFESPIASSFVFGNAGNKRSQDAHQQRIATTSLSPMHGTVVPVLHFDDEGVDHSDDTYHDPDDDSGSISDSDSSLTTFSLEADSIGLLDKPPQWVSTRSFTNVREVVDHTSGLSSRALSGTFLDIESRSGRFSVDLQRDRRLDKVDHPPSPDTRLSIMKTEKPSSRRSLLSPCLPFLHRPRNVPRLQQASLAASRRLQSINSFTARLGPIAEVATKLHSYNSFTARIGHAAAASASKLQAINSFTTRLGPLAGLSTPAPTS